MRQWLVLFHEPSEKEEGLVEWAAGISTGRAQEMQKGWELGVGSEESGSRLTAHGWEKI
jgi:hypothetical protein